MQKCPNCNEETIKDWDKFMNGPARSIICNNCNAKVSISWTSMIYVISIVLIINLFRSYLLGISYYIVFAILLSLYAAIAWRYIPLKFRGFKE